MAAHRQCKKTVSSFPVAAISSSFTCVVRNKWRAHVQWRSMQIEKACTLSQRHLNMWWCSSKVETTDSIVAMHSAKLNLQKRCVLKYRTGPMTPSCAKLSKKAVP
eukprot:6185959-Pleurochrysis_carterae.AAC.1